jgi:hypothetical protein
MNRSSEPSDLNSVTLGPRPIRRSASLGWGPVLPDRETWLRNATGGAELLAAGGPPDPAAIGAVMRRHGLTPVQPATTAR